MKKIYQNQAVIRDPAKARITVTEKYILAFFPKLSRALDMLCECYAFQLVRDTAKNASGEAIAWKGTGTAALCCSFMG